MNHFERELLSCCIDHRIINRDENYVDVEGEFYFPDSFSGFRGHFPQAPVLPAVIQLTMIRTLAEQALTQRLFPTSYGKTKFRRVVKARQTIYATLKLNFVNPEADCDFQLKLPDGQLISNGSCVFTPR